MGMDLIYTDLIGELTNFLPITVSGSSASSFALSGDNKGAFLMNVGSKNCALGGDDVSVESNLGIILYPGQSYIFRPIKAGTSIYAKCTSGDTTTIAGFEYAGG